MAHLIHAEQMPFYVRRLIWRYKPYLRNAITDAVREKSRELASQGKEITAEEIGECASSIVFGAKDRNLRMEQLCLAAVDHKEYKLLREVIDELRSSIAESPAA